MAEAVAARSAAASAMTDTARSVRLCFHCGQPGHRAASCPTRDAAGSSATSQSAAGQAAFHRYLQCRRELAGQRRRRRRSVEQGKAADDCSAKTCVYRNKKGPMHHYDLVVEWMKDAAADQDCRTSWQTARDPIAILHEEAEAAIDGSKMETLTQRRDDLHKAKRNNLDKAHREAFNHIMDSLRRVLANRLDVTPKDETASKWWVELSRAVVLGRPANFSSQRKYDEISNNNNEESSGRCLKVYAVEKLQARCRQLHHLVFNNDQFSAKIRSLLLPTPQLSPENDEVHVVSLGGGPGYDHVALCIAAKFLHGIQPQRSLVRQRRIKTQVFDLFDRDWEPVMTALGECCCHQNALKVEEENGLSNNSGSNMAMHHADIRLTLDDPRNADLARAVATVDIICVQFVLHENASFILEDSDYEQRPQRIGGVIKDIFERAPPRTIMICTDSSNTLFPPLKNTARAYGWVYLGDEEKRENGDRIAFLGPKSYVILERISM